MPKVLQSPTLLTNEDVYLFIEGSHFRLYEKLGAHLLFQGRQVGTYFAVWAPNARQVSVIGVFNGWNNESHLLYPRAESGLWEGFIPGVGKGALYKYHIISHYSDYRVDKADPFAFYCEPPPGNASIVWDMDCAWGDEGWMGERKQKFGLNAPVAIYELHLGSWRLVPEKGNRPLTYREMAPRLAEYVLKMGFTHIELLPVMEHPFGGSWGYQVTGYFAPTSRYGTPQDFMYLVDFLHRYGIGVILDWVPSHFPADEHGLAYFDGTHLYEHADPRRGVHPDWNSHIFNYGRNEVRSFLISSALFWLHKYHADGLRVDAVASMLYRDYSRKEGEWIPNKYGGREDLEAISFLKRLNAEIYRSYPDVQTVAEESTAWPMVSHPTYAGGLGFGYKWDMGWMHDTLEYMSLDPVFRKHHHGKLTFRMVYAFHENFILPLSHDEVVHGKGSMLGAMHGNDWQKFASFRLLLAYMYTQPGKKLLFMGAEFGQWGEWNHETSLDWNLLQYERHTGIQRWVEALNRFYRSEPGLHELDCDPAGFEPIDYSNADESLISFIRKGRAPSSMVLVVCNFTPVFRLNRRIAVPRGGVWKQVLNSDDERFGGSQSTPDRIEAQAVPVDNRHYSLSLSIPPLAAIFLKNCDPTCG
ncbi:MAG: 1,4-alpha-glucan branching protein GlgB [Dehalococcoidales bacterium]|nr:1,4-alpha-glucan branching protein GlgB [Dehalococcoidales bacterium]